MRSIIGASRRRRCALTCIGLVALCQWLLLPAAAADLTIAAQFFPAAETLTVDAPGGSPPSAPIRDRDGHTFGIEATGALGV